MKSKTQKLADYKERTVVRKNKMEDESCYKRDNRADFRANCCSSTMIQQLLDMALNGVVPDGYYSDFECNVWSDIKSVLRSNGIPVDGIGPGESGQIVEYSCECGLTHTSLIQVRCSNCGTITDIPQAESV